MGSVALALTLSETLIRVLLIVPADSLGTRVPADLHFEDEGAARLGKTRPATPQEVGQTVRMLCSLTSDPQLVGHKCSRSQSFNYINYTAVLFSSDCK